MLVVSAYKDKNINHFLTLDIHSIFRKISSSGRPSYVYLSNHDEKDATNRWRLGFLERLYPGRVFTDAQRIPRERITEVSHVGEYSWSMNAPPEFGKPLAYPFRFDSQPSQDQKDVAKGLVEKLNFPVPDRKIILFIVRRGTNRNMRDSFTRKPLEDVVIAHLSPQDRARFVVTSFESMSFLEQASLASRADVIVGAHGAALTNFIFAKQGSRVIEISLRSIFMCDPVCEAHLSGLSDSTPCSCERPYYHKADYKSLADVFGLSYTEVSTVGGSLFTNENPLSVVDLFVDGGELADLIGRGLSSATAQQKQSPPTSQLRCDPCVSRSTNQTIRIL